MSNWAILDCLDGYFPGCGWYSYRRFDAGEVVPPGGDLLRPPVTHPSFCTGQDLWRLGMPKAVLPSDDRFEPGAISELVKAGPPTAVGGMLYSAARRDVSIEHLPATGGESSSVRISGTAVRVFLSADPAPTKEDIVRLLAAEEASEELLAKAEGDPAHSAPFLSDKIALSFGVGTLLVQGMPTDNYGIIFECTRSGFIRLDSAKNRTRPALFRLSLNLGKTWTPAVPYTPEEFEPKSTGLLFQFSDGAARETNPFLRGERFVITTYQSEQFRDAILSAAAQMVRSIAVREVTPLLQWEKDLCEINAVLAAYSLMSVRGMDATSTSRTEHNYDREIYQRKKDKEKELELIVAAYQRLIVKPSGETPSCDVSSELPQGTGLSLC